MDTSAVRIGRPRTAGIFHQPWSTVVTNRVQLSNRGRPSTAHYARLSAATVPRAWAESPTRPMTAVAVHRPTHLLRIGSQTCRRPHRTTLSSQSSHRAHRNAAPIQLHNHLAAAHSRHIRAARDALTRLTSMLSKLELGQPFGAAQDPTPNVDQIALLERYLETNIVPEESQSFHDWSSSWKSAAIRNRLLSGHTNQMLNELRGRKQFKERPPAARGWGQYEATVPGPRSSRFQADHVSQGVDAMSHLSTSQPNDHLLLANESVTHLVMTARSPLS